MSREISLVTCEIPNVMPLLPPAHTIIDFVYRALARLAVEQLKKRMKKGKRASQI